MLSTLRSFIPKHFSTALSRSPYIPLTQPTRPLPAHPEDGMATPPTLWRLITCGSSARVFAEYKFLLNSILLMELKFDFLFSQLSVNGERYRLGCKSCLLQKVEMRAHKNFTFGGNFSVFNFHLSSFVWALQSQMTAMASG